MKRIALVLVMLVGFTASGCGGSQKGSSHPHNVDTGTALVLTGLAVGMVGLIVWAAASCDSCGDEGMTEPRPYPYPQSDEW